MINKQLLLQSIRIAQYYADKCPHNGIYQMVKAECQNNICTISARDQYGICKIKISFPADNASFPPFLVSYKEIVSLLSNIKDKNVDLSIETDSLVISGNNAQLSVALYEDFDNSVCCNVDNQLASSIFVNVPYTDFANAINFATRPLVPDSARYDSIIEFCCRDYNIDIRGTDSARLHTARITIPEHTNAHFLVKGKYLTPLLKQKLNNGYISISSQHNLASSVVWHITSNDIEILLETACSDMPYPDIDKFIADTTANLKSYKQASIVIDNVRMLINNLAPLVKIARSKYGKDMLIVNTSLNNIMFSACSDNNSATINFPITTLEGECMKFAINADYLVSALRDANSISWQMVSQCEPLVITHDNGRCTAYIMPIKL